MKIRSYTDDQGNETLYQEFSISYMTLFRAMNIKLEFHRAHQTAEDIAAMFAEKHNCISLEYGFHFHRHFIATPEQYLIIHYKLGLLDLLLTSLDAVSTE